MAGKINHKVVADGTPLVDDDAWNDSLAASEGSNGNLMERASGETDGWKWSDKLKAILGISATSTAANNLRGSATLSGGTATVTFGTAEPDSTYYLTLAGDADEVFRWGSKSTTGFTITSSNPSSTATVDWHLIR
jgi:hypothetical protein